MQFILDNWEAAVGILFFVIGVIVTGKRLAYWRWANGVFFYAWIEAERQGILDSLKGVEKLRPYIDAWRAAYESKWGKSPTPEQTNAAVAKAAQISAQHKAVREVVGNS